MELRMKTKLEIIEETVEYYSFDTTRRALTDEGFCTYLTEDGKMCAFGRLCINPAELTAEYDYTGTATLVINDLGFEVLKEEYRILDKIFWQQLQGLHDYNDYWDSEGLTTEGINKVNQLKLKYSDKK